MTKRAWGEAKADNVSMLAGGVAFFSFLSLFPAITAAVLIWSLVANPASMRSQASSAAAAMPAGAKGLLIHQINYLISKPAQSLGIGLVISVLLAFWSASGGVGNLISAINITYDEEETRNWFKRKALALFLTIAMIIGGLIALALVAVAPVVFSALGLPSWSLILLQIARWLILLALIAVGLAVLYRLAPDRDDPKFKWVSTGAVVATVIWLIASLAFSLYVSFSGSYSKTYGSLAAVAILMLWLYITFYVILLGAEINAETEAQTLRDTTTGPERPIGDRDAVKADDKPADPDYQPASS